MKDEKNSVHIGTESNNIKNKVVNKMCHLKCKIKKKFVNKVLYTFIHVNFILEVCIYFHINFILNPNLMSLKMLYIDDTFNVIFTM
jgi:hypothetical protein